LSTISKANQIIVLEHGKVIETGKHEELLSHSGRYAHLWKLQSDQNMAHLSLT
jgi:ABC-type transport system involved in Fe-S cluster assembly fused permease/ATPase subunit